jgi:hypothetical protein
MTVESFVLPLFKVNIDLKFIDALAVQIQEKHEATPTTLMLYSDNNIRSLCPVTVLLVWMKVTGIKTGYLFTKPESLRKLAAGGSLIDSFTEKMPYETFNTRFKALCGTVVRRDGPFGSHTCRKTGYLIAVWGGGEEGDIMKAARHTVLPTASTYKRDAKALLDFDLHNGSIHHLGIKWKPIKIESTQLASSLNSMSLKAPIPLPALAHIFFQTFVQLPQNRYYESISMINHLAQQYVKPKTIEDQLRTLLKGYNITDHTLMAAIQQIIAQEVSRNLDSARDSLARNQIDYGPKTLSSSSNNNDVQLPGPKSSKKRVAGENDLQGRHEVAKIKDNLLKLDRIILLHDQAKAIAVEELTEGARNYLNTSLTPVIKCLTDHCDMKKEIFLSTFPNFSPSKFYLSVGRFTVS